MPSIQREQSGKTYRPDELHQGTAPISCGLDLLTITKVRLPWLSVSV